MNLGKHEVEDLNLNPQLLNLPAKLCRCDCVLLLLDPLLQLVQIGSIEVLLSLHILLQCSCILSIQGYVCCARLLILPEDIEFHFESSVYGCHIS